MANNADKVTINKPRTLGRLELEDNVWEAAVKRARQLYEEYDHVAVEFSGGKDSTATLHAVLAAAHEKPEERLPVRVIFWDEEAIPPETVDYVRRVSQRDDIALEWYCIPIRHRNGCSSDSQWWYPWAPEDREKWVRELPPEAITDLPGGYKGLHDPSKRLHHHDLSPLVFNPSIHGEAVRCMGIRAQESLRRAQAVSRREVDNWIIQDTSPSTNGALWKAYPVYDWTADDVWTAPAQFGWDHNYAYDQMEMEGLTSYQQRVGPPFGQEALAKLYIWKTCWPEMWDQVVDRVPGAATAARYANTDLYAYKGYPQKPDDGSTWPEFIITILRRQSAENQPVWGARVQKEIRLHDIHCNTVGWPNTIAPHAPHPETGVSWDFLAMLAQRGDTMGRKDPRNRRFSPITHPDQYQKSIDRYRQELADIRAAGHLKETLH